MELALGETIVSWPPATSVTLSLILTSGTRSMIRSKLPCFPRAVPVRVQRKRGKVSVSKRVDRKKVSQQSTK